MDKKQVMKIAKALSDENRLDILNAVATRGSLCCSDAQKLTELSQPTISHHISLLTDAELLNAEKDGRIMNLSINRETFKSFIAYLKEIA